jgi:hypothetical protein
VAQHGPTKLFSLRTVNVVNALTLAPFFSRCLTVASPMPLAAPVTNATFPFKSIFFQQIIYSFDLWSKETMAHPKFVVDLPIILYFWLLDKSIKHFLLN